MQTATLLHKTREDIGVWYKFFRQKMMDYIAANPIHFTKDDIVEIDEAWLDNEGRMVWNEQDPEYKEGGWILGFVSRNSNKRLIIPLRSRQYASLIPIIRQTVAVDRGIITDQWKPYKSLKKWYSWWPCYKIKAGTHSYPSMYYVYTICHPGLRIPVHTNTIEGMWSLFRNILHMAHGYTAEYLPYIIAEFHYRSLQIPFLPLLHAPIGPHAPAAE